MLFAVIGVPQLFWKPSRFSGIFLLALAIGCMGEWLMLCGREKHKACRILSRVGRVLFALFVLSFAAVQVFVIGIVFDEDDPSAAPQADYYLVLGALVNPERTAVGGSGGTVRYGNCGAERQSGQSGHPVRRSGRR